MSHGKVRDEKTCLNCGAPVPDRFCSHCGQENIAPKQTVWHLVNHFFSDVTHFDGKFFVTVKDLFHKPGFLSTEYVRGRRVEYLDPIRMYIFTSAFFFLIFFSIINLHDLEKARIMDPTAKIDQGRARMLELAGNGEDSSSVNSIFDGIKGLKSREQAEGGLNGMLKKSRFKTDSADLAADSIDRVKDEEDAKKEREHDSVSGESGGLKVKIRKTKPEGQKNEPVSFSIDDDDTVYKTVAAYDSAQRSITADRRDGWLKRILHRKQIETNEKWHDDKEGMWREWAATFIHNFPKILFVSLPLFALLLKLLYVRRREFYYVDHGIFSVHLYIYTFIVLLAMFGLNKLHTLTGWSLFQWLLVIAFFYPFVYYYKAMRNFYHQGRGKTLLKYFSLLFLSFIVQLILFALFFLFTIVQT